MDRTCQQCGRAFRVPPSVAAKGRGKYCSKACAFAAPRPWLHTQESRTCRSCGTTFQAHAYRVQAGRAEYCSIACSKRTHPPHPPTVTCARCGVTVPWPKNVAGNHAPKYCSQACYDAVRARAETRRCRTCAAPFVTRHDGHYCARACYRVWQRRYQVQIACARCQQPVTVSTAASARARRYCSQACYRAARAARPARCQRPQCRRAFTRPPWRHARYCSHACANRGRPRRRVLALVERDARILALHAQGWKAPAILAQLGREHAPWGEYRAVTVRQVISRARLAGRLPARL